MGTIAAVLGICFGIIFVLFLAGALVWLIIFKCLKGTSNNIKEIVKMSKEPKQQVKEIHTFVYEDGVKKEIVEVMK